MPDFGTPPYFKIDFIYFLDKVSWLPPAHPKAKITEAASHVREMIQNQIHMEPDNEDFDRYKNLNFRAKKDS